MFAKKITLFARRRAKREDGSEIDVWYRTMLDNVQLEIGDAEPGEDYSKAEGKASVSIKLSYGDEEVPIVSGKRWLSPDEWQSLDESETGGCLTFDAGRDFGFFTLGDLGSFGDVIEDDGCYGGGSIHGRGFYGHVSDVWYYTYRITSVKGPFGAIPHLELTGTADR